MNTNPPPVTAPSGSSGNSRIGTSTRSSTSTSTSTSNTSYRYKTYSGLRETTYNGRQVCVNSNGGYSYYVGGPVIAYMPGYTPIAYTPVVAAGPSFGAVIMVIMFILVAGLIIALLVKRL